MMKQVSLSLRPWNKYNELYLGCLITDLDVFLYCLPFREGHIPGAPSAISGPGTRRGLKQKLTKSLLKRQEIGDKWRIEKLGKVWIVFYPAVFWGPTHRTDYL